MSLDTFNAQPLGVSRPPGAVDQPVNQSTPSNGGSSAPPNFADTSGQFVSPIGPDASTRGAQAQLDVLTTQYGLAKAQGAQYTGEYLNPSYNNDVNSAYQNYDSSQNQLNTQAASNALSAQQNQWNFDTAGYAQQANNAYLGAQGQGAQQQYDIGNALRTKLGGLASQALGQTQGYDQSQIANAGQVRGNAYQSAADVYNRAQAANLSSNTAQGSLTSAGYGQQGAFNQASQANAQAQADAAYGYEQNRWGHASDDAQNTYDTGQANLAAQGQDATSQFGVQQADLAHQQSASDLSYKSAQDNFLTNQAQYDNIAQEYGVSGKELFSTLQTKLNQLGLDHTNALNQLSYQINSQNPALNANAAALIAAVLNK